MDRSGFIARLLPTNQPNVMYVPPPPPDFHPHDATDDELSLYGYPPRPKASESSPIYKQWLRHLSAERIVPQLEPIDLKRTRRRQLKENNNGGTPGTTTSLSWCGAVLSFPNNFFSDGNTFSYIAMTVPNIQTISNVGDDRCVVWTGFDGYGEADVFQGGFGFNMERVQSKQGMGTVTKVVYVAYAWVEWFPGPIRISNLVLSVGDNVIATLMLDIYTSQGKTNINPSVSLHNYTTNKSVTLAAAQPPNITFIGNEVEWILERPKLADGNPASLTNFGVITINECSGISNDRFYDLVNTNGASLTTLNMVNSDNTRVLADVVIPPPIAANGIPYSETMTFTFRNSA